MKLAKSNNTELAKSDNSKPGKAMIQDYQNTIGSKQKVIIWSKQKAAI